MIKEVIAKVSEWVQWNLEGIEIESEIWWLVSSKWKHQIVMKIKNNSFLEGRSVTSPYNVIGNFELFHLGSVRISQVVLCHDDPHT